jgi:hypothetical protein
MDGFTPLAMAAFFGTQHLYRRHCEERGDESNP